MIAEPMTRTFDPTLIVAWLAARSLSRNLPPPVPDHGGFRIDTGSAKEIRRWIFPEITDGLRKLAHEIHAPRHPLKLCGPNEALRGLIPDRWQIQPANYVMTAQHSRAPHCPLPDGYRLERTQFGPVTQVRVLAADGTEAAGGFAAETSDVFIYDRIGTAPSHRRRGLGKAVMGALNEARRSQAVPQILVATADGRALYTALGWSVYAPYATAVIPA